jgi:hypothetical protein
MKIEVTNLDGSPVDLSKGALSAVGKAFLIHLDVILGLIFFSERNQRLLNYVFNTIVVKKSIDRSLASTLALPWLHHFKGLYPQLLELRHEVVLHVLEAGPFGHLFQFVRRDQTDQETKNPHHLF